MVAGLFGKADRPRGAHGHHPRRAGVLHRLGDGADEVLDGARFNATVYEWMVLGGLKMEVGFLVDGLTAMMMCVVTFVSLMVHIYTIGYMAEDPATSASSATSRCSPSRC
jgi:NADH-quinone oxidoreductase subunit L